VPADTVRRITEAAGRQGLADEIEEATAVGHGVARAPVSVIDHLQQVSVDGAMVPLVHGQWAEVKSLAIGRVVPLAGGPKAVDLSYFARLADHVRFTTEARLEFERRGTENAREVVAVSDGAEWIQGFLDEHCPVAVRIIDWSHAAGYLSTAGQALFGPGSADGQAWVETQREALWKERPESVVEELKRLETDSALEPVRVARQYLERRVDQLRYAEFRAAGYPVGSGIVESANKVVVEERLKGRGRRWEPANVDPMLVLRCMLASDRWCQRWPTVGKRLRRPHRRRPTYPRPAAAPSPPAEPSPQPPLAPHLPPPPMVVDGKPTPIHPWKLYPACRAKT